MQEVSPRIHVGSRIDFENLKGQPGFDNWAIVHATKKSHQAILGYTKPIADSPNYLVFKFDENNLYLNIVDMKAELLPKYTDPIFKAAFEFIDQAMMDGKNVLVYCDQGGSRSPGITLAYLAGKGELADSEYVVAKSLFLQDYPDYEPNDGIELYLKNNWHSVINL